MVSPGQTLLILTAMNASNNYFPLLASEACAMLPNTARSCVENCEILKLVGLPCGAGGPNQNVGAPTEPVSKGGLGTGGVAGVSVFVVIFVFAVLLGAVFYYRRKYKAAKVNSSPFTHPSLLLPSLLLCCETFDLISYLGWNCRFSLSRLKKKKKKNLKPFNERR